MTVRIRRACLADAAGFARMMGDPAVFPGLMQLPYTSEDLWRARLADMTAPGKPDLPLVAERTVQGQVELIGSAGLHPVGSSARLRHAARMGISVVPEAQGQGVGTALMAALCDSADRWMQLQRIQLEVYTDNAPALALYRKFGFEIESTQRGYALRDGAYVDSYTMGRLHPSAPLAPAPETTAAPRAAEAPTPPRAGNAGGRWVMRAFEASDVDATAALMLRRGIVEGLLQTPLAAVEAVREQLARPAADCALVALSEGHVIGHARLTAQTLLRRRHAAGALLFVAPEWQRRGIGSALLAALLDWADRWAGLLRIEAGVPDGNAAALALASRFGFEAEGRHRAAVLQDGAFADLHPLARLHPHPPRVVAAAGT